MVFLRDLLQSFLVEVIILIIFGIITKLKTNRRHKKTAPKCSGKSKGGSSKV